MLSFVNLMSNTAIKSEGLFFLSLSCPHNMVGSNRNGMCYSLVYFEKRKAAAFCLNTLKRKLQ